MSRSRLEIADKSTRRSINVFPLRQISSNAFGSSAAIALASFSGRLTVMLLPPTSTPTKLLRAILKPAIRRAAQTGGLSSTCGNAMAIARISDESDHVALTFNLGFERDVGKSVREKLAQWVGSRTCTPGLESLLQSGSWPIGQIYRVFMLRLGQGQFSQNV
jgi:hypothetical protein